MTSAEMTQELERLHAQGYRTYQDWLTEHNAEQSDEQWTAWMASGKWMLASCEVVREEDQ